MSARWQQSRSSLSDVTVADDNQPEREREYCYFEYGSLKFNAGANTGGCNREMTLASATGPGTARHRGVCSSRADRFNGAGLNNRHTGAGRHARIDKAAPAATGTAIRDLEVTHRA